MPKHFLSRQGEADLPRLGAVSASRHLQTAFPDVQLVAEEDSKALREDSGKAMRARVTELVNTALARDGTHCRGRIYHARIS